ncbi:MAG: D-Ala-D-Ala carboxypeptidase family metallohydrolase [Waddliaceae bacterium]
MKNYSLLLLIIFFGCINTLEGGIRGGYIKRKQSDKTVPSLNQEKKERSPYSWEKRFATEPYQITKEHFRCRGSGLHAERVETENEETIVLRDCVDGHRHTLPLDNDKEFIYPILIDLLNYIQDKTEKKVIITSGHRCPTHNRFVDPSKENQTSKHQIGAEVSFYVKEMETQPSEIVDLITKYYPESEFDRYEKKTNVSTLPWYNKEIFIKLFLEDEGRNGDNTHSYPYLSIQVRFDKEKQERVSYTWESAYRGFKRK